MDKQYSVKFFTSFVEAMQKFCREYIEFDQCVELSGYLAVEIDNHKKERYVLSEMLQSSGNVISESYCTKAFKTLRKEPSVSRGSENIGPRTTQAHPEEVTIVLRDSPEMVSHVNTQRHQRFSNQRSSTFSHSQRGYSSGHTREIIKLGNPFDQQVRHTPNQIQPRSLDSSSRNNSSFSPSSAQKRPGSELNHQQESPAAKKDKCDSVTSILADPRNVYSGDTSESQQIAASTIPFSSQSTSQNTGESIRLPLSATVKEEGISSVITLETSDNTEEHTTESDIGDNLQETMSLGMDASANYSNSSQSGIDENSASSSAYISQFKVIKSSSATIKYRCEVCGKESVGKSNYRHHMEKHNLSRFPCLHCGKSYSFQSALSRHLKTCPVKQLAFK